MRRDWRRAAQDHDTNRTVCDSPPNRGTSVRWPFGRRGLLLLAMLGSCVDGLTEDGSLCVADIECRSGLCYGSVCMQSDGDLDGDGLTNAVEASLGTHADGSDSDGDGLPDAIEVGEDPAQPTDTDGDYSPGNNQRHDANESAISDADGDCVADQLDRWDGDIEADAAQLAALSCLTLGVCGSENATVAATCEPAGVVCHYDSVPGWESVEFSCDGLDNDCDGAIDEGSVYSVEDGAFAAVGTACQGVGACSGQLGVVECRVDGGVACSTSGGSSMGPTGLVEQPCNGVDDDCDGLTDGLAIYRDASGGEHGVGEPCVSPGICQGHEGIVTCLTGTTEALCSTGPGGADDVSQGEVCNGADDDCDGDVDESLFYEPVHGGAAIAIGEPCGVAGTPCEGMNVGCLDGVPTCCQGTSPCVPWSEITEPEACDGVDTDCDGALDEALAMHALCAGDVGVCAANTGATGSCESASEAGADLTCDYTNVAGWQAEESLCDGLDNDCDGEVDEAITVSRGGVEMLLGEPCAGVGACAGESGVVMCNGVQAICDALSGGSAEQCNGVDDDCDGALDEDTADEQMIAPQEGCLTLGVCAESLLVGACVAGQLNCGYMADPLFEAVEDSCDALDNDCDGWIDEGTDKVFSNDVTFSSASQPVDRARWVMVVGEGGPYLFGGLHNRPLEGGGLSGRPLADLWRLDQSAGAWVPMASAPKPLAGHAMTWSDSLGGLVVHGGFSISVADTDIEGAPALNEMWLWRMDSDTWHPIVQSVEGDDDTALGRVDHTVTARSDGSLLMHGGRGLSVGAVQTWVGDLSETTDVDGAAVQCQWSVAAHQSTPRHGHAAIHDAEGVRTLLLGGVTGGTDSFLVALADMGEQGWEPVGTLGKTQPAQRREVAVAMVGGVLILVGGLPVAQADSDTAGLDDAWRYDSATDLWTSFSLPEGVPELAGAFLLPNQGGTWRLGGGHSQAPVSWRQSWLLDISAMAWGEGAPWLGLAPRTGAAVIVDPSTARMWVVGGSRMPGAFPLMDAHEWSPGSAGWQALSADLAPAPGNLDLTRPALEGAAGAWSPVDEVGIVVGGYDLNSGGVSTALWALDPDAVDPESRFSKLATYGDVPPGVLAPVFTVDAASTGWLAGRFGVDDAAAGDNSTLSVRVYSLDLTGYTWTLRWDEATASGGPSGAAEVLGGTRADGLGVLAVAPEGGLSLWHFDPETNTFTSIPLQGAVSPVLEVASWTHDPQQQALLVTSLSSMGPETWRVDLMSGVLEMLPSEPSWPGNLEGVATGVHPVAGLVLVGGHDPGGYTSSTWSLAAQSCP
jgi:hypothetical protein